MSTDNTSEDMAYCEQVSRRKDEYESAMLTQKSLVELGAIMSARAKEREEVSNRYKYLLSAYAQLSDFHPVKFMQDYNKMDPNTQTAASYSLATCLEQLKELHACNLLIIESSKKEIAELKSDVETSETQSAEYIDQLDEAERNLHQAQTAQSREAALVHRQANELEALQLKHKILDAEMCRNTASAKALWRECACYRLLAAILAIALLYKLV